MKYIILIHSEEGVWKPEEYQRAITESIQVCHELAAKRQYLHASPLQPSSTAVRVQVRDGKSTVTSGPYAETAEIVAGYFLVEADSVEEVVEVAKRIPGATRGTAEIRPLMELTALPKPGF